MRRPIEIDRGENHEPGAAGTMIVPGGTGNSELQAELLLRLGVTTFLGTTASFSTLIERLEALGSWLPDDWMLKHAFLGGELWDWSAKRRRIEERYNLKT